MAAETNTAPLLDAVADAAYELAREASIELSPRQVGAVDSLAVHLRPGTRVYVPFVPGADWQDSVRACERLHVDGMRAVPHLEARSLLHTRDLDGRLHDLAGAGVAEVMLVAGDRTRPAGPFRDTLDVLDTGRLADHGMKRLGITGYPEGHPLLDADALAVALARKREYAAATGTEMSIVSQFAFEPARVLGWLETMGRMEDPLPIRIGVAGPARLKTLLAFAARCGVGASARVLARRPSVVRLLNNWTPDSMLRALARHRVDAIGSPLSGIHLFTFGGLPQTSRWLRDTAGVGPAPVVDFHGIKSHGGR